MATRKKKASKWLIKARNRRRIRVVGMVLRRDTGRPELVYGRRSPLEELEHEVMVAEVEVQTGWRILRGMKVGKALPDGTVIIHGKKCYLEIDNSGKMTAKQYTAKWRRYGAVNGYILVIAHSDARMQRLRKGAELIKDVALFTTFERLLRPEKTAVDWFGNETQL